MITHERRKRIIQWWKHLRNGGGIIHHSSLGLRTGLVSLRLGLVITTAPSLILPKDSWIEIRTLLTLISSLYFEVLLMDWRVRALSTHL